MDDAVASYCEASAAGDVERMMATLAEDAEVVSPLSGRMVFRGPEDVRGLLGAVYGSLEGLRWGEQVGTGATRLVLGEARIAGLRLDDAMVFELGADGRIVRVRPHLRPWLATTVFALRLGVRLARRPGSLIRALRG